MLVSGGHFRWIALYVVALVLLCCQHVDAQVADSAIRVRVPDLIASGNRANISLSRPGDIAPPYEAEVDANGEAIFSHVPPGSYRVIINHPERAAINEAVEVAPGEVLIITVKPAGHSAQPNTSAIDLTRHRFSSGTVFNDIRLHDLPDNNSVWSLIETSDPLTFSDRMDTGGLSAGDPALISSFASSWTQASFQVDGVDVTDLARGGTPFIYPDLDAFSAATVVSSAMPVEIGPAGPAVALVPRRPTRAWLGEMAADWTPSAGRRSSTASEIPAIANVTSWNRGHVLVSGPLVKDRVGMLLSGTMIRSGRQEREGPAVLPGDVNSIFAHIVVTPEQPYELRFILAGQRLLRPFPGRARFKDDNATESDRRLQLQATWEARSQSRWPRRISAAYEHSVVTPQLDGLTTAGAIERLRDGPVPELVSSTAGARERWTTSAEFEPKLARLGHAHDLRYGLTLSGVQATAQPDDPPGLIPELVGGIPARVWDYQYVGPISRWRETLFSAYAADRFIPSRFIAIEGGLRLETLAGKASGAPTGVTWTNLSPRVSLRWKPLGSERATIISSYGRYQSQLPLNNLAFGDPTAARGLVYRWVDANNDKILQTPEIGPLIALVGPGSVNGQTAIDPDVRRPYTDAFVIGIETRRTDSFMMRFAATFRRERNLLASVNVGVPLTSYTLGHVQDPGGNLLDPVDDQLLPYYNRSPASFGQDRELLTNPQEADAKFHGMELIVERTFVKRFQMLFGATATGSDMPGANRGFHVFENDQGVIGERLTNPNADTFSRNRQFFERGYSIKILGSYHAPHDVRIGLTARYQDGQPFARIVLVPQLNQGTEAIQAYRNGRSRFTYALTVDGRIEKHWTVGAFDLSAVFETFNLLNTKNEVEEDVLTGPNFRAITAVQPPRVARLGLRLGL